MTTFAPETPEEVPEPFDTPEIQKLFKRLYAWVVSRRRGGGYDLAKCERNAPCLCGSGRKAKKCCLNKVYHTPEEVANIIERASKEKA